MQEYNFDPMTGEPIKKDPTPEINPSVPQEQPALQAEPEMPEVQAAKEEPSMGAPTEEQPIYHYAPTREPEAWVAPSPVQEEIPPAPQAEPAPNPKKKQPKPVTFGGLIPVAAIVLVLAIGLGFAGGFAANGIFALFDRGQTELEQQSVEDAVNDPNQVVIYKTAKLVDDEGDEIDEPLSVAEVAALVENSVVEITTEQIVSGSFMQQYVSEGAGSGVIITSDGYLVTNNHVIEGATNINVRLKNGTSYAAKLIGADAKTDLAVIKIEAKGLTPAAFGKSAQLNVGETVVAVGNPLGELGGTVTQGIISALDREINIDNTTMSLLQTDTAINPGNSGGGLFNTSGQLVGVVNAKSAGEEIEGLGFAIPIDTADKVIRDLINVGYVRGRVNVGIAYLAITDQMTALMYHVSDLGLYVYSVEQGSDAEKAGLKSGDLLVSIDGKAVATVADAGAAFDAKKVGDTVNVVIKRGGKEITVPLKLTEYVPNKKME